MARVAEMGQDEATRSLVVTGTQRVGMEYNMVSMAFGGTTSVQKVRQVEGRI